jgi:4-hydroxythreonine-4-phosphate dehydrogenase
MTAPLAVSMGDPAGIGPELIVKAWSARRDGDAPFFALADPATMARAFTRLGLPPTVVEVSSPSRAGSAFSDALPVLPVRLAANEIPGSPDARNGPAIVEAIRIGTELCLAGEAAAIVTCPISKAVLYETGFAFPGHTEFVADLTKHAPMQGARGPVMMLAGSSLRVALVTIHQSLIDAARSLQREDIVRIAQVTADALTGDFAIASPRLALCGLNPHAGEGGAMGREEIEIINPAAVELRTRGINITDARPADSLFHEEARRSYDAVIAMTHDQGLIPLKTLHFWDAVNLTLGLPIVRTSPDHGTGFDIAGANKARAESMIAALDMGAAIAKRRAAA